MTQIDTTQAQKKLENIEKTMQKTAAKVETLRQKMEALGNQKFPTDEFLEISRQIETAEADLERLNSKKELFLSSGGSENSQFFSETQSDIEELEHTIEYARGELQDLVDTGKAFTLGSDTAEYQNLSVQLAEEQANLNSMAESTNQAESSMTETASEAAEAVGGRFGQIASVAIQAFGVVKNVAVSAFGAAKKIASTAFNAIKSGAQKAGSAMVTMVSKGGKMLSFFGKLSVQGLGAFKSLKSGAKSSGNALTKLTNRIWGLVKRVFFFSLITKGLRSVLSGIQEGFTDFASSDTKLTNSINQLKVSLNELKGSFGAAVAPIASIVIPYLQKMVNWLISAVNAVGAFIATLTGQSTYKKASAGLDSIADSADNATSSAQALKKELAGYDELNVISQDANSGSGSGSGSSSGSGITYTDEEIGTSASEFAEKVKEAWANADFTEIGNIVAEKLKSALESVNWTGIQTVANKIGASLATFINGAIETADFAKDIGMAIGEAINTGLALADGFITNFHFDSLGEFIADAMNEAVLTIKWSEAGQTIAAGLNGVFTAASTWANKFDFATLGTSVKSLITSVLGNLDFTNAISFSSSLGTGIATALNNVIDSDTLGSVGTTLAGALNTVFAGAKELTGTIEWKNWGVAIGTGINNFFADADLASIGVTFTNVITAIYNGIKGAVTTVDWAGIGEKIATAIGGIDWGTTFSAIFSTTGAVWATIAKVLATWASDIATAIGDYFDDAIEDCGGNVVAGFLKGIIDAIADIATWVYNNIFSPFIDGIKEAFGIHSPSKVMEEQGGYIIDGLLNGITNGIKDIGQWIKDNILDPIIKGFEDAGTTVQLGVELIKSGWSTISGFVGDIGAKAFSLAKDGWGTISGWVGDIGKKAFKLAKDGWSTISGWVGEIGSKAFKLAKDGWSTISGWVGEIGSKAVKLVKSGWATISGWVGEIGSKAVKLAKSGWTSLSSWVGTSVKAFVSLAKKGWTTISNFVGTTVSVGISLIKKGWTTLKSFFGLSKGGSVGADGSVKYYSNAKGGIYSKSGILTSIPQYASGTTNAAHGTMFVAGESGAEIVGNINGRTEVLNKSQIASAIYSAVLAAMQGLDAYAKVINETQISCANAINTNLGSIMGMIGALPTYGATYGVSGGTYNAITDTNKINAIRDGINASGAIGTNDSTWMDTLAAKINGGSGGNYTFVAQLNGREIFRETVSQNNIYKNQTGKSAFA